MMGLVWFIVVVWVTISPCLFFLLTYPSFRQQVWSLISEGQWLPLSAQSISLF